MIELALLLSLGTSLPVQPAEPYQVRTEARSRLASPRRCDDGSSFRHADGSPNWDCELHGCSPHASICWSERLDFCYDESGDDAGVCAWGEVQTCNSRWTCFDLWTGCNGKYECHEEDSWIGCTDGTCTPKPTLKQQAAALAFVSPHEDDLVCPLDPRAIKRNVTPSISDLPDFTADDTVRGHGDV